VVLGGGLRGGNKALLVGTESRGVLCVVLGGGLRGGQRAPLVGTEGRGVLCAVLGGGLRGGNKALLHRRGRIVRALRGGLEPHRLGLRRLKHRGGRLLLPLRGGLLRRLRAPVRRRRGRGVATLSCCCCCCCSTWRRVRLHQLIDGKHDVWRCWGRRLLAQRGMGVTVRRSGSRLVRLGRGLLNCRCVHASGLNRTTLCNLAADMGSDTLRDRDLSHRRLKHRGGLRRVLCGSLWCRLCGLLWCLLCGSLRYRLYGPLWRHHWERVTDLQSSRRALGPSSRGRLDTLGRHVPLRSGSGHLGCWGDLDHCCRAVGLSGRGRLDTLGIHVPLRSGGGRVGYWGDLDQCRRLCVLLWR